MKQQRNDAKNFEYFFAAIAVFLMLVSATLLSCTTDASDQSESTAAPAWAQAVDAQVRAWVDNGSVLGGEVLVIQHGEPVIHEVYGLADIEEQIPFEKNQLYAIHSMTKPFVGTAILMLAEQGELDLDDRASEYLEAYQTEACEGITIRQLLNHTAGFGQPGYPKGSIDLYANLEEAVNDLAAAGPAYPVGEEYHYSDGHSATLGLIVMKLSGMSVEHFIREKIFGPLGMQDSYCELKEGAPDRARVCNVYVWREGAYQKLWDHEAEPMTPFFRASGGIRTSPADYAKFLALWMNGGTVGEARLFGEESVRAALTPSELHDGYGLHWELYHAGLDSSALPVFGHGGSSGTVAIALPSEDAMVFYFTQSRGTLTGNFLTQLVLQELGYTEKKEIAATAVSADTYEGIAGEYMIRENAWRVEPTEGGISLISGRLVPIRFLAVADTFFVQPYMDWDVRFVRGQSGEFDKFVFRLEERELEAIRRESAG